ncbi:MAG: AmmeMemoRadiSam system radical SAM enzyme [Eubacterium sp.]|nr:AmmeMemoRadiSam system radical SAM enzyme [Eubacterium sp.]
MRVVCQTCMHHCSLQDGQLGRCGARKQEDGRIVCANYGWITAMALDPIEKKPLRKFYPGSRILSVGSFGCNLRCPFCQNYEIARKEALEAPAYAGRPVQGAVYLSPEELADKALEYESAGNIGLAFTYNEPLVGWEYVRDTAKLVKKAGMKTVLVTNATASLAVLEELLPWIDAMNIDLKGFRADYYRRLGGDLETVKAFIRRAADACHVELTTLIVPGENDDAAQMEEEAQWIGSGIPLHVTRFFPRYHMTDREATDVQTVYRLANLAGKYVEDVFVGNC